MTRRKISLFLAFLTMSFFIAGEFLIPIIFPLIKYNAAALVDRHNYREEGWYEFTKSHPSGSGLPTAIMISNSQGVGREVIPSKTYFGQFKDSIRGRGLYWNLENWSKGGLSTAELDLLTLRAFSRQPEKIILLLQPGEFDASADINLSKVNSDMADFIVCPKVRELLPYSFFNKDFSNELYIRQLIFHHSNWIKLRKLMYKKIGLEIPVEYHPQLFGDYMLDTLNLKFPDYEKLQEKREVRFNKLKSPAHIRKMADFKNMNLKLTTISSYAENLSSLQKMTGSEVIIVWTPRPPVLFPPESEAKYNDFVQKSTELLRDSDIQVVDLSHHFPKDRFIGIHFSPEGHDEFCVKLLEVIGHEF